MSNLSPYTAPVTFWRYAGDRDDVDVGRRVAETGVEGVATIVMLKLELEGETRHDETRLGVESDFVR